MLVNETGRPARSRPDGQTPTSGSEVERPPALSDPRGEAPAGRWRDARSAGPGRRCRVQTRRHRPAARTLAGRPKRHRPRRADDSLRPVVPQTEETQESDEPLASLPGKSHGWRSLVGCSPWVAKSRTRLSDLTFTFHFHVLEKEMATHSSVLAWRIPGTGEPGGLPSMGSHRVGHD